MHVFVQISVVLSAPISSVLLLSFPMAHITVFPHANPESSKTKTIAGVQTGPRLSKARSGNISLDKFLATHRSRKITKFKHKWRKRPLVRFVFCFLLCSLILPLDLRPLFRAQVGVYTRCKGAMHSLWQGEDKMQPIGRLSCRASNGSIFAFANGAQ